MTKKQCARREHNKLLVQMGLMGLIQSKAVKYCIKIWAACDASRSYAWNLPI